MRVEVVALAEKEVKAAAEAERVVAEQAALKARGQAIGSFIGGIFGGKDGEVRRTIDPTLRAPVPAPRIQRG